MNEQINLPKAVLALFVVLVSWPASFPASRPVPIAIVQVQQGSVRLQRKHQAVTKITGSDFLREDDIITIENDSSAYLYQVYARPVSLRSNETKKIIKLPPAQGKEIIDADHFAKLVTRVAAAQRNRSRRSPGQMGGPNDLAVTTLAPRESLVIEARPTFEWTPVASATAYAVTVHNDKQTRLLWQTTTKETHAIYPDSSKPLPPGKYIWQVKVEVNGEYKTLAATHFFIATPAQARAARAALERAERLGIRNSANLFYIQAAFEHRLYPLAERNLKEALRRTPADEVLWALLMQAYKEMKRYEDRNRILDYLKDPKPADLKKILGIVSTPTQK